MKITSEMIEKINKTASENFDKAEGMLEMLNEIAGTDFKFLAKRVCWSENSGRSTCFWYAAAHDLCACLWYDEEKGIERQYR